MAILWQSYWTNFATNFVAQFAANAVFGCLWQLWQSFTSPILIYYVTALHLYSGGGGALDASTSLFPNYSLVFFLIATIATKEKNTVNALQSSFFLWQSSQITLPQLCHNCHNSKTQKRPYALQSHFFNFRLSGAHHDTKSGTPSQLVCYSSVFRLWNNVPRILPPSGGHRFSLYEINQPPRLHGCRARSRLHHHGCSHGSSCRARLYCTGLLV